MDRPRPVPLGEADQFSFELLCTLDEGFGVHFKRISFRDELDRRRGRSWVDALRVRIRVSRQRGNRASGMR